MRKEDILLEENFHLKEQLVRKNNLFLLLNQKKIIKKKKYNKVNNNEEVILEEFAVRYISKDEKEVTIIKYNSINRSIFYSLSKYSIFQLFQLFCNVSLNIPLNYKREWSGLYFGFIAKSKEITKFFNQKLFFAVQVQCNTNQEFSILSSISSLSFVNLFISINRYLRPSNIYSFSISSFIKMYF